MTNAHYSASEERLNVLTHALGVVLSLIALTVMVAKTDSKSETIPAIVFGVSLITLYSASTLYHASKDAKTRSKLRILDHASIYILIAGTYTPVCMITLSEKVGQTLLLVIWSVGIAGVVLKLFFTGKYDRLSTVMYVIMGWIAVFAIKPLMESMPNEGLFWLLSGGVFYTLGALLYSIKKLPMNHAIFHVFVLLGSSSHFIMIYFHVL